MNQGVIYIGQIFAGKRRFRVLKGVFDRQGADDRHAGNQQNEGVGDTTLEPDWVGVAREKHCETSGGRGVRGILGFALCFGFDFSFDFGRFDRPAEALMRVQQSAFVFKRFIYGLSQQIKV